MVHGSLNLIGRNKLHTTGLVALQVMMMDQSRGIRRLSLTTQITATQCIRFKGEPIQLNFGRFVL